jgi:hypothetical protein
MYGRHPDADVVRVDQMKNQAKDRHKPSDQSRVEGL